MKISRYEKGKYYEFKLMAILKKQGFFVIRSPGSGRRYRKFYVPDIVAIKKGSILLIECRFFKNFRHLYLDKSKFKKMEFSSRRSGGTPLVCVFYKGLGEFRCLSIWKYSWESGNYYVFSYKDIIEKGFNPETL